MNELIEKLKAENAELKAQLARVIVPKYYIGQEVWGLLDTDEYGVCPFKDTVVEIEFSYRLKEEMELGDMSVFQDDAIFATEAEALKSLENKDE